MIRFDCNSNQREVLIVPGGVLDLIAQRCPPKESEPRKFVREHEEPQLGRGDCSKERFLELLGPVENLVECMWFSAICSLDQTLG